MCVYDSDSWSLNVRLGIVIALRLLARAGVCRDDAGGRN